MIQNKSPAGSFYWMDDGARCAARGNSDFESVLSVVIVREGKQGGQHE